MLRLSPSSGLSAVLGHHERQQDVVHIQSGQLCERCRTRSVTWATRPLAVGSPPVLRVAVFKAWPVCTPERQCK